MKFSEMIMDGVPLKIPFSAETAWMVWFWTPEGFKPDSDLQTEEEALSVLLQGFLHTHPSHVSMEKSGGDVHSDTPFPSKK